MGGNFGVEYAINDGYQDLPPLIVEKVNDQRFIDFEEFAALLSSSDGEFTQFSVTGNLQLVLDHRKALQSQASILQQYNVPRPSMN